MSTISGAEVSPSLPQILSTWSFGPVANAAGWKVLSAGGSALDAVVSAATAVEEDEAVDSVGYGGMPDVSGHVSLDACVMINPDRCGSVSCLRRHVHAAAIARRVMDSTWHVMLTGEDADAFADREGFPSQELLAPAARTAWLQWRAQHAVSESLVGYKGPLPVLNAEESRYGEPRHDTVCILARDAQGMLAGACSTSGLAFKVPGRVGDSPIIGHGLYVDQEAGAAAATGVGERVMGTCASFLAVERMRAGDAPLQALLVALKRIATRTPIGPEDQVAMIAMTPDGRWASAALRGGFVHCLTTGAGTLLEPAQQVLLQ